MSTTDPTLSETLAWPSRPVGRQMVANNAAWAKTIHAYLDGTFGVHPVRCEECDGRGFHRGMEVNPDGSASDRAAEPWDCDTCQASGYLKCDGCDSDALFFDRDERLPLGVKSCLACALSDIADGELKPEAITVLAAEKARDEDLSAANCTCACQCDDDMTANGHGKGCNPCAVCRAVEEAEKASR